MQWDDLKAFLAIARTGGLSSAARLIGVSPATLGRYAERLESDLDTRLFERTANGYRLTEAGEALRAEAQAMEDAALAIARWREGQGAMRVVRLSAGSWMSRFLAHQWPALWTSDDAFRLGFVSAEARLDIARREADIGLRNQRPIESGLAGRSLGAIAFASYQRRGSEPAGWIASTAATPSAEWVRHHHGSAITVEASTPPLLLDLARQGAGRAILPCFVGDRETDLERSGPLIDALTHTQWLVLHHDTRHRPAIRTVIRRVEALIQANRPLFEGAQNPAKAVVPQARSKGEVPSGRAAGTEPE